MARVDFFYDFTNPVCYLAARAMRGFGDQRGALVEWVPVFSGTLRERAQRMPWVTSQPRCRGFRYDAKRWADLCGVPFQMAYPAELDPTPALCAAQGIQHGDRIALTLAIFAALWQGAVEAQHGGWVVEVCRQAGLPESWARPGDPEALMVQLRRNTEMAWESGILSVPAFFLTAGERREPFHGLEQLDLLRWTLERGQAIAAGDRAASGDAGARRRETADGPHRWRR